MTSLVIVGAGGHGRETLDIVEALGAAGDSTFTFVGFVDDGEVDVDLLARRKATLLGDIDLLGELSVDYVIGIGDPVIRAAIDARMTTHDRHAATLVHPAAIVASDNRLDPGVIVAAGAVVTTNVHLGRHTHLNVGAVVSHDCRVGDHVTLSPGVYLNGDVTVEDGTFLGTGAIVTPGVTIGTGAVVGAGAVVTGDVAPGTTVVGVPARAMWTPG